MIVREKIFCDYEQTAKRKITGVLTVIAWYSSIVIFSSIELVLLSLSSLLFLCGVCVCVCQCVCVCVSVCVSVCVCV